MTDPNSYIPFESNPVEASIIHTETAGHSIGLSDTEVSWMMNILRHKEQALNFSDLTERPGNTISKQKSTEMAEFCLRLADDPWSEGRFQVRLDDGGMTFWWQRQKEKPIRDATEILTTPEEQRGITIHASETAPTGCTSNIETHSIYNEIPASQKREVKSLESESENSSKIYSLTKSGLKLKETHAGRSLIFRNRLLPLSTSTANIVEIIAVHPRGITLAELHGIIRSVTGKEVDRQSLEDHLLYAGIVFAKEGMDSWQDQIGVDTHGRSVRRLSFSDAKPRSPKEWPSYLKRTYQPSAGKPVSADDQSSLLTGKSVKAELEKDALCSQIDPELFYVDKGGSTTAAKFICSMCEVRPECTEVAFDSVNDEREGVEAGLSPRERRKIRYIRIEKGEAAAEKMLNELQHEGATQAVVAYKKSGILIRPSASDAERLDENDMQVEEDALDQHSA